MENQYRVIFDIGGNAGRSSAVAGQSTQQSEIKDLRHQQTAISSVKSLIASDLKGIGNIIIYCNSNRLVQRMQKRGTAGASACGANNRTGYRGHRGLQNKLQPIRFVKSV